MSRLYFHSPSGDAELRGSERAWLDHLSRGPAVAAWDLDASDSLNQCARILAMVPEVDDGMYGANYLHRHLAEALDARNGYHESWKVDEAAGVPPMRNRAGLLLDNLHELEQRLLQSLKVSLRASGLRIVVAGHELNSGDVELNTALAVGSDPIKLAAKLHGWCEVHAWVDGPDRAWLADVIQEGLDVGLYRQGIWYVDRPCHGRIEDQPDKQWCGQGWEDVLTLLRTRDDEPVVTSYSVTDQFPNRQAADWMPTIPDGWRPDWANDEDGQREWDEKDADDQEQERREYAYDQWYELPADEQWQLAMDGLRSRKPWLQLTPDSLGGTSFGPSVTVYDLLAPDRDERVRAAFAKDGEDQ